MIGGHHLVRSLPFFGGYLMGWYNDIWFMIWDVKMWWHWIFACEVWICFGFWAALTCFEVFLYIGSCFFLICADFLQFWIGNETPTANDLRFRGQWGFGSMWSMSPSLSRKTASGQPLQAPLFHVPLKYKMGTIMRPDICKIPRAPGALHCWVSNLSCACNWVSSSWLLEKGETGKPWIFAIQLSVFCFSEQNVFPSRTSGMRRKRK